MFFYTNVSKLNIKAHSKYDKSFTLMKLFLNKLQKFSIAENVYEKKQKTTIVLSAVIEKGYEGSGDLYQ